MKNEIEKNLKQFLFENPVEKFLNKNFDRKTDISNKLS